MAMTHPLQVLGSIQLQLHAQRLPHS